MQKRLLIFSYILMCSTIASAQYKPRFVNHTEAGGLFGRVRFANPMNMTEEIVDNKLNLTLQTFNGIQVRPNLATGLTFGVDWYTAAFLTPVSAGIRWNIVQDGSVGFFGTLDAGYGFAWFHEDITGNDTQGGYMVNPGFGLRCGKKAGFTVTMTYKRQAATVTKSPLFNQTERVEDRVYNRLALRLGISF